MQRLIYKKSSIKSRGVNMKYYPDIEEHPDMEDYPELSMYPRITGFVNPESFVDLNELIVRTPPQGDWKCGIDMQSDSIEKWLREKRYDPKEVKFVSVYEGPMLTGAAPIGIARVQRFIMFTNIGNEVARLERGFKERCRMR